MKHKFTRQDLHDYQIRAVEFIKDTPSCALWVEMGLGKTVSTLTAIVDLFDEYAINRVLVVAPVRVAAITWPDEIPNWEHTKHLTHRVVTGTPAQRAGLLSTDRSQIHLIGREQVQWLVGHYGAKWPYDMVVIDESSSFKNPRSKRFKELRKVLPFIDRVVELTGTPAPKGLLDLWSQMFLLDRGERLGKTFGGYQRKYFYSDYHGYTWTAHDWAAPEIHGRLQDLAMSMTAKEYLGAKDVPPIDIPVELPSAARKDYKILEREFLFELENGGELEVLNMAALTAKLSQFVNGAMYIDREKNWIEIHDAKLKALEELVEAANGEPMLVAYWFKPELERLKKRFPDAVVFDDDPTIVKRWNAGKIKMLLCQPASVGHGLNLQFGGHVLVWYNLIWSLELYLQFIARLDRQGQTKPVRVYRIRAENTIDDIVIARIEGRHLTQSELIEAFKASIRGRV